MGPLDPGTYTTQLFQPHLTYTVPAGWSNFEDLPGNFLLVPPGGALDGVNGGTSDYIGIYTSVLPNSDCNGAIPDIDMTPAGMAGWFADAPGFDSSNNHAVTVGGLSGQAIDLKMKPGWNACLALTSGIGLSGFEHTVVPSQRTRQYLLSNGTNVLSIEVVDVNDSGHLDGYSKIIEGFTFAK